MVLKLRIVNVDTKIIEKLRRDNLSTKMKSLEFCTFLVIEEENDRIIGASGIGGMVNNHSIIINEEHKRKGLGLRLFKENIEEAKRRRYSYITSSRNPKNIAMVKLHEICNFEPLLRINYSPEIVSEAHILPLNGKGCIIQKLLGFFNTKFGFMILAILLKSMKSQFGSILTLSTEEFEEPNFRYIVSNFKKYK